MVILSFKMDRMAESGQFGRRIAVLMRLAQLLPIV